MLGSSAARALWCWCCCCSLSLYHTVPLSKLPSTGLRVSRVALGKQATATPSTMHAPNPPVCMPAGLGPSPPPHWSVWCAFTQGLTVLSASLFLLLWQASFPGWVLLPLYPCTSTQAPWGLSSVAPWHSFASQCWVAAGEHQQGSTRCTAIWGAGQKWLCCSLGPLSELEVVLQALRNACSAAMPVVPRLRCHRACFPPEAAQQSRVVARAAKRRSGG